MINQLRALALAAAAALPCSGAYLASDGIGQALIYPYYTVQTAGGTAFNTLFSVVNHADDAKVLRLQFRDGRGSKPTLFFDIYLAAGDVWTGGLVPSSADPAAPARLVTADTSCTNPPLGAGGEAFRNFAFVDSDDGAGTGLDRTREGYFEIIEMAALTGATAAAASHLDDGGVRDCAPLRGVEPALSLAPPTGGLSGTLTLVNVLRGMEFSVNAEAIAGLSTRTLYRSLDDALDFNAPEIDPVSEVTSGGFVYRTRWSRPVDAVSAILMRSSADAEYVLDRGTLSRTDIVLAFPTRLDYVTPAGFTAPFSTTLWSQACTDGLVDGESTTIVVRNRETRTLRRDNQKLCGSVPVIGVAGAPAAGGPSAVLGSRNEALGRTPITLEAAFPNGWLSISPVAPLSIGSHETTRMDLATGATDTVTVNYFGLPMVGFAARSFENDALACGPITCQGNFGGAFPLTYRRDIRVAPN